MRAGTVWRKESIGVELWGERYLKKTVRKTLDPKAANEELWLPEMDPSSYRCHTQSVGEEAYERYGLGTNAQEVSKTI